jgi:hypothetical protein
MTEAEQLQVIRNAIYAMVNSLGAAMPRTPELQTALDALVQSDHGLSPS